MKALPGNVTLVGLDSARPSGLIDSSGLVGEAQREAAARSSPTRSLATASWWSRCTTGCCARPAGATRATTACATTSRLTALLDRADVFVDLVVHGHMHTAYPVRTTRRLVVNAGSATDLRARCGYNVYEIDAAAHRVVGTRRTWNAAAGRYEADPTAPTVFEATTR